jgi:hypothetical protein
MLLLARKAIWKSYHVLSIAFNVVAVRSGYCFSSVSVPRSTGFADESPSADGTLKR